jgi:outer membrane protein insertion porin family
MTHLKRILKTPFILFACYAIGIAAYAQTPDVPILKYKGTITQIQIEGLKLIEKGLVYSTLSSQQGLPLSPQAVFEDIKSLYKLGYFNDIKVEVETLNDNQLVLIFKFVEKPRIALIEIVGSELLSESSLREKLKVFPNNMVNHNRIKADVDSIMEEYRKKGYMQTVVTYEINAINESSVSLTYAISESPKVFLTTINITGTKAYPPLDIERRLSSAEIDCFAWANDSGVFQESKVNQDLQIITQHYLENGYIKVKIDKPKVVLIRNRDYARVIVDINITEGDQYFTGNVDILSQDGNELLFDKAKLLAELNLQPGKVFNPFKQNDDRYKINDIYLEQGYAFSRIRVTNDIDETSKIVHVTFHIERGEKAYIGRVEIQGNYETIDRVIRRELEIHDNELYNGVKLRGSQQNITRLGYFEAGSGVRFQKSEGEESSTLDYNIILKEGQTGTFNASITYSGDSGLGLNLSISKKNFLGTGRTISLSIEGEDDGDRAYTFSLVSPYWFDTQFTNTIKIYSTYDDETYYDTRSDGFSYGLSYPIWKDWSASTTYSWLDETYDDITDTGEILLENKESNTYRTVSLGIKYSTVDHPLFPANGSETSLYLDQIGGDLLGGETEYRVRSLNYRYFKTLNESGSVIFGIKFNWSYLDKTNPDKEIPYGKRYTIGGITTVRGFDWYEIKGPASDAELSDGFDIEELYPYQAEYMTEHGLSDQAACNADPVCASLPSEKSEVRDYFEKHSGGIEKRVLNLQLYFPLTREGTNIKGLVFFDAGNVWAEDRMYEITGLKRDDWYYRKSIGTGVNIVTPMGVLRFEYGYKLDRKEGESAGRFDFHISGLF